MKKAVLILFMAMLVGTEPAMATSSQLVLQVQKGIERYGFDYDVSEMSTQTVTQLKFALSRSDSRTRWEIQSILRRAGYPE